jgi:uncharacterized OB-fold protein
MTLPLPERTTLTQPYWEALERQRLVFQECSCGQRWAAARPQCPKCLRTDRWQWRDASGRATLISWVIYHVAYHPAFAERLPYNVAIVELEEGPRMMTNVIVDDFADLKAGMPLELNVQHDFGVLLARFAPAR